LHLTLEYFLPQHPVKPDQYSFTNNVLVAGNPLEQASEKKNSDWHLEKHLTSEHELIFCPNHSQFDQSTKLRSTALYCDWIFWNDTSVGMAQKLNMYVCIHLGWICN